MHVHLHNKEAKYSDNTPVDPKNFHKALVNPVNSPGGCI